MTPKTEEIKYYFCKTKGGRDVPTFFITPKKYFDEKGFLLDSGAFDPRVDQFQRVADSTFEYVGKETNPENILLKNGQFMWRGMEEEISYLYRRRRLLGIDNQE
jgi:hypothetical protein